MQRLPQHADAVVIGAGIVGNSIVSHLAERGWRNLLQIDKGPLPNPGGSTGHASNFIFPVDHSKEITLLTLDSTEQYKDLGVLTQSGGIEVARTPERVEELRRRLASARSWGIESRLLTPAQVKEHVPFVNEEIVLAGFYTPTVAVVDPVRAGTLMREHAQRLDALTVVPNVEVLGMEVEDGRIVGVSTDRGDVTAGTVVVASGVWSPRLARMAGASIPLTPAVHQMIDVGPLPELAETLGEIAYPIVRDMDTNMYERQNGSDLEIGSYAHRPILHEADDIPALGEAKLSPTELPFTEDDFVEQMEQALELFPSLAHEGAGVRHAINGLLSLTPDGGPVLGETEVRGLWSAAAVWIKEGPAVGRQLAAWITDGLPEIELHGADIARFYRYARTGAHVKARAREAFPKTYGIVHPREQWASNRPIRVSPFYPRERELGAVFFEAGGWERPQWYAANEPLLEAYADRVQDRPHEWDARWWSPIVDAEHLALRDGVAMIDLTAFAIFDVLGPGALDYTQNLVMGNVDRPAGRIVYTPVLAPDAGFRSDLTVTRLGERHFRVVTGGGDGARDWKWFADHLPADGSVQLVDMTSSLCTVGVWGPRARDLVQSLTREDLSHEAFPFANAREVTLGTVPTLMGRISYVGDLGWEIHAPMEQGLRLWDLLWEAGQPFGVVPAGIGVYGTTGRMEKGYRLMGHELELEYDVVEAGLAFPKVKAADFVGREAYLRARETDPAAVLCTLTVDDHASRAGVPRYMQGNEPILTRRGVPLVDRKGRRSYVTSAGPGPSVGRHLLMAYLPPEDAYAGCELAVEYMDERYPVTVAVAGRTPLFDPEDARMKC